MCKFIKFIQIFVETRSLAKFKLSKSPLQAENVLCQVPANLECPESPKDSLTFQTNKKCYVVKSLKYENRSFEDARKTCLSMNGMRLANLEDESELYSHFIEFANSLPLTYERRISNIPISAVGFYFQYTKTNRGNYFFPNGKKIPSIETDTVYDKTNLALFPNTKEYVYNIIYMHI